MQLVNATFLPLLSLSAMHSKTTLTVQRLIAAIWFNISTHVHALSLGDSLKLQSDLVHSGIVPALFQLAYVDNELLRSFVVRTLVNLVHVKKPLGSSGPSKGNKRDAVAAVRGISSDRSHTNLQQRTRSVVIASNAVQSPSGRKSETDGAVSTNGASENSEGKSIRTLPLMRKGPLAVSSRKTSDGSDRSPLLSSPHSASVSSRTAFAGDGSAIGLLSPSGAGSVTPTTNSSPAEEKEKVTTSFRNPCIEKLLEHKDSMNVIFHLLGADLNISAHALRIVAQISLMPLKAAQRHLGSVDAAKLIVRLTKQLFAADPNVADADLARSSAQSGGGVTNSKRGVGRRSCDRMLSVQSDEDRELRGTTIAAMSPGTNPGHTGAASFSEQQNAGYANHDWQQQAAIVIRVLCTLQELRSVLLKHEVLSVLFAFCASKLVQVRHLALTALQDIVRDPEVCFAI